jgi:hypothetical protein
MRLENYKILFGVILSILIVIFIGESIYKNWKLKPTTSSRIPLAEKIVPPLIDAAPRIEGNEGVNWQQGLTPDQISERLEANVQKRGGRLQVWKDNMKRVQGRAERIKDVKLTPELERFLDKVDLALLEYQVITTSAGARLAGLMEAKQAYWACMENYYVAPTKAVLRNDLVYFTTDLDAEVDVTLHHHEDFLKLKTMKRQNFSRGWAIKLGEKDTIMLYHWNFNLFPPADGIIGIATEFE